MHQFSVRERDDKRKPISGGDNVSRGKEKESALRRPVVQDSSGTRGSGLHKNFSRKPSKGEGPQSSRRTVTSSRRLAWRKRHIK